MTDVRIKFIEGGPSNFRTLYLQHCGSCKYADIRKPDVDGFRGCLKHPENEVVTQEMYLNTVCDDWEEIPALDLSKLNTKVKVVQYQMSNMKLEDIKK